MNLTPREKDKLLVSMAAMVARGRRERGVKLNHPEAIALITDFVVEGARDGRSVADLMEAGAHVVTAAECMEGVPEMIHDVQVEATFPDGTKLVTVHHPIRGAEPQSTSWHKAWVGAHYSDAALKLLIIGDSHHSLDAIFDEKVTIDVVNLYLGGRNLRFFTQLALLIGGRNSGQEVDNVHRAAVYSRIAFFNAVPNVGAVGPREKLPDEYYDDAARVLLDRIMQIEPAPDVILVCGFELSRKLAARQIFHTQPEIGQRMLGGVPVFVMKHPSSGFSSKEWNAKLESFLGEMRIEGLSDLRKAIVEAST